MRCLALLLLPVMLCCDFQPEGTASSRMQFATQEMVALKAKARDQVERLSMVVTSGKEDTTIEYTEGYVGKEVARIRFQSSVQAKALWDLGFKRMVISNARDHWSAKIERDHFEPEDAGMR